MDKSISFVLPMYNEAENIKDTIRRIFDFAKDVSEDYEIIVVDDASCDGCGDMVDNISRKDNHVKSIRLKENTKFGGALAAGIEAATKEIILYTDSDLPANEGDMKAALQLLTSSDIVTAYSLVIKDLSIKRVIMSKVYNFLVEMFFGLKIRDINSGLKIYKRKIFEGVKLISRSPFIDAEIFAEAKSRGYAIKQYGLIFSHREKGKSSISRIDVVWRTVRDMLAYRFKR